jgi:hypothetical protein
LAQTKNWPLRELRRDVRTLETVFNELTTALRQAQDTAANAAQGGDEA